MDAIDTILRLAGAAADETGPLEPWGPPANVLAGRPAISGKTLFTSFDGSLNVGLWQCTPGKWRVAFSQDELCVMLAGRLVVTDPAGKFRRFGPGDAFMVPAGFRGTWEVVETVRRLFAVHQAGAA
jgi:hypothetical protein